MLLYSITGEFKPPDARNAAAFSKSNWDDYDTVTPNGKIKKTKCALVFLKTITKLKDQQWEDIHGAALALHDAEPLKNQKLAHEEGSDSKSDGEVLLDPMYDETTEYSSRNTPLSPL